MPTLGQRIKELRIAKKWTYVELAEATGLIRQTITAIEHDSFKSPGPDKISKLARALEVPERELFELAGYATPEPRTQADITKPLVHSTPLNFN